MLVPEFGGHRRKWPPPRAATVGSVWWRVELCFNCRFNPLYPIMIVECNA
ncbi:hypothetical protein RchiOBHm_Chr4g0427451 [Rosa chinensis]|uniref:Uncharacterized protein n=1 Tax=Rosa chinensis TaxID=74649 RepID=A0A2P6QZL6_ROSCH|nr:hypothetical protein RchiOBHm_Chr4g0427451 [Rosa chinensis]